MSKLANIACPVCKQRGDWFAADFGPFCSKRCRLIDLGKWFGEEHAISEPLRAEHLDQYAELPSGRHLDNPAEE
ncbi:MAG: DNA gyrase inhibitor YacG [Verrucomicrobiota bacterium]